MSDILSPAILLAYAQGLHQVPTGEVRTGDIAYLSVLHQLVQCAEGLIERSHRVESMQMIDIDIVRTQPFEASVQLLDDVVSARSDVVRSLTKTKCRFSRNQYILALVVSESFTQSYFTV